MFSLDDSGFHVFLSKKLKTELIFIEEDIEFTSRVNIHSKSHLIFSGKVVSKSNLTISSNVTFLNAQFESVTVRSGAEVIFKKCTIDKTFFEEKPIEGIGLIKICDSVFQEINLNSFNSEIEIINTNIEILNIQAKYMLGAQILGNGDSCIIGKINVSGNFEIEKGRRELSIAKLSIVFLKILSPESSPIVLMIIFISFENQFQVWNYL